MEKLVNISLNEIKHKHTHTEQTETDKHSLDWTVTQWDNVSLASVTNWAAHVGENTEILVEQKKQSQST